MKPYHERIENTQFRKAVDFIDKGDVENLERHLLLNPEIVRQRVLFGEKGYFSNPGLLEFIAENPVRHGTLPANIVEVTKVILLAGAEKDQDQINVTLGLVASGMIARQCHVQIPLINLLCTFGADADQAMPAALTHGEFEAVGALIKNGAQIGLSVAAALGRSQDFENLFFASDRDERQLALALAAQHGKIEILKILVHHREPVDRYNPPGAHEHSTPLHQAVLSGNLLVVKLLVEAGARLDIRDKLFNGTPLDWAIHEKLTEITDYLRSVENI